MLTITSQVKQMIIFFIMFMQVTNYLEVNTLLLTSVIFKEENNFSDLTLVYSTTFPPYFW